MKKKPTTNVYVQDLQTKALSVALLRLIDCPVTLCLKHSPSVVKKITTAVVSYGSSIVI